LYKKTLNKHTNGIVNETCMYSLPHLADNDLGPIANGDGNWGSCVNKVSHYLIRLELRQ